MPTIALRDYRLGFTLIELAVTLTVIGVLAAIAAPSFQAFLRSNRLSTVSNDLLADLNYARTEAIKRQGGLVPGQVGQMVMCVSSNGTGCTGAPDTWGSGWIVFWDQDQSGTFSTAANDILLKSHSALPQGLTVSTEPADTSSIAYNALGMTPGAGASGIKVVVVDTTLSKTRTVTVNKAGQGSVS